MVLGKVLTQASGHDVISRRRVCVNMQSVKTLCLVTHK